jgi:cytochrome o ubiquinol oxidase subunit 1
MLASIDYADVLGKLNIKAFEHDLIEASVGVSMILGAIGLVAFLTYFKRWTWIWKEWITSVDHKKIGIMYIIVAAVMLFKGLVDVGMLRAQQALSVGDSFGYLSESHFQQIFTAHGVTMIFFVAMGMISGLMNILIPLQIGARDVAFPVMNSISFWLFTVGAMIILVSLMIGNYSGVGWTAYPPLSGIKYSPDVGVDYWIWSLQISGIGTLLTGINLLVTIFKMRCHGMTFMKMPLFVWASLNTLILIVFAFPILTATLIMLSFDRTLGMHFFTDDMGGNVMMYVNLFWAWGHPEVYILVLPSFGIFSEVVATFSQKKLFGYASMVWALIAITFLSFLVWLHHFFTMGAGPSVNAFFGIMTMVISVPTGVKVFNWIFTMCRGRIEFKQPMLWFLGFIVIFTIGGMNGVLMGVAPADFQIHNSLFLVAHFHSMIIGGVLFGIFAGYTYWFPKIFGFKLHEKLGEYAAYCWIFGFLFAFIPLYALGLMGATRRLDHYEASTGWQPLFMVAAFGAGIITIGMGLQALQLVVSIMKRNENQDLTGDPWNGRTLEWSTASPAPFYNFAVVPNVDRIDSFWAEKQAGTIKPAPTKYEDIHMPRNSWLGAALGLLGFTFSFGVVWFMWWMVIASVIGTFVCLVARIFDRNTDYYVKAEEVNAIEIEIAKRRGQQIP